MDAATTSGVLNAPVTFTERPSPLPADLRIEWRMAFLLCVLRMNCRGGKSSLQRLQVINWAARSRETRRRFLEVVATGARTDDVIIRVEPGLNHAIAFAAAENLIERPGGNRLKLTTQGRQLASQIQDEADCLAAEKEFLSALGMQLTEQRARKLIERG